jgi:hypothetical protein
MTSLVTSSLLLALLSLVSLSTSQQTAIITELPAYSSLSPCAASVVSSAALLFSNLWCRPTTSPVPLASCICLTEIEARYEVMCELGGQRGSLNCYVRKLSFMPEKRASPRLNIGHVDPAVSLTDINSAVVSTGISDGAERCISGGSLELSSALSVLTTYCAAASQNNGAPQATKTTAAGSLTDNPNSASSTLPAATGSTPTGIVIVSTSTTGSVSDSHSLSSSTSSPSPMQAGGGGGISFSDRIALGVGIGIGVPTLLVGVICAYFAYLAVKRKSESGGPDRPDQGIELTPRRTLN